MIMYTDITKEDAEHYRLKRLWAWSNESHIIEENAIPHSVTIDIDDIEDLKELALEYDNIDDSYLIPSHLITWL